MKSRPSAQNPAVRAWGASAPHARVTVLAVHGRGQTPEYMRTESERLTEAIGSAGARIRFVAPCAPGDSWYPHPFLESIDTNQPALDNSIGTIGQVLDGIVSDCPVVLWGFSQGACLISHYLLVRQQTVAGAVICTGGYIGQGDAPKPATRLHGLPVIIRSVQQDPFVPPARVRETGQALARAGCSVDLRIDSGAEHVITDEAIVTMAALLEEIQL